MNRIKILNAFSGIGGNRIGIQRWSEKTGRKIEVTAIEFDKDIAEEYTKNFPRDTVIVDDAWEYIVQKYDRYDIIWASPPCQSHSRLNVPQHVNNTIRRLPDFRLYALITYLKVWAKKQRWVVENVMPYYTSVIQPTAVLNRHYFWTNFQLPEVQFNLETYDVSRNSVRGLEEYIGISLSESWKPSDIKSRQILRNCVHPDVAEYVITMAMKDQKNLETWLE